MVRRMDYDASWTRLFGHSFVAAQLVRLAVPELAERLDLSTLKPLHTRWARSRPPAREGDAGRKVRAAGAYALRTGDQAWRVWHADDAGNSLILPVEYQSSPDGRMGLRSLEYALLAHEMESRRSPDADGWLRVLPLVLYSGGARWARHDPSWAIRRVQMSGDGQPMLPLGAAALLLDADSHGSDDSDTNIVASLLSLNVAPDWEAMQVGLAGIANTLREALPAERAGPLIDDLMDWVSVCQPQLSAELLDSTRRSLKREEEPEMMALARMGIEYPRRLRAEGRAEGIEKGRAEGHEEGRAEGHEEGRAEGHQEGRAKGIEEGREEGLAHERELLVRQATRKFDVAVARRLGEFLADADAAGLAEAGDWIIDCNTGEELIARASGARNGR